ncbi:MAG: TetR/AcrR family transcriptional regulator [Pseudoclavibacter sp.]
MSGTREALVSAATELVDRGGPDAVKLREVGRQAGVSHNAPYKHFVDKEALLAEVAAAELHAYARILRGADGGDVQGAIERYVARAMRYPRRFRLVYREWATESDALTSAASHATESFDALIAAAKGEGRLGESNPADVGDLLRATVHGAIELALTGHLGKRGVDRSPAQLAEAMLAFLSRAEPRGLG